MNFHDELEEGECKHLMDLKEDGMEVVACKVDEDIEYRIRDEEGKDKGVIPLDMETPNSVEVK